MSAHVFEHLAGTTDKVRDNACDVLVAFDSDSDGTRREDFQSCCDVVANKHLAGDDKASRHVLELIPREDDHVLGGDRL
jgi:hypothetical protein